MAEAKEVKENIIELMGREDKKQAKKAYLAIQKAFSNKSPGSGRRGFI